MDAAHKRKAHRLVCVYTTVGIELPDTVKRRKSACYFPLGRFKPHYENAADLMPELLDEPKPIEKLYWTPPLKGVQVERAKVYALGARTDGNVLFVLELDYKAADLKATIPMLYDTAIVRRSLKARVDGKDVAFFAALRTAVSGAKGGEFGLDVHQLVFPASGDCPLLVASGNGLPSPNHDLLARLVYRADEEYRVTSSALCLPLELNRPAGAVAAHARGVTVLAGAAPHVETAVMLTAVELLAGVSQLRAVRRELQEMVKRFEGGLGSGSIKERRQQLAEESGRLARLEVDLCFGVEAAMDANNVPEVVLEPYRRSLAEALGMRAGVAQAANAIARLSAAIAAMRGALESLERQAADNRRDLVTNLAFTISVVAFVLSAVFGYFSTGGNDIAGDLSIINGHYWPVYAILVGVLVALFLRWRFLHAKARNADQDALDAAVEAWKP